MRNIRWEPDPALMRGMTQRRISRRQLFRYAGAGAGALGLAAFLEACGVGGGTAGTQPTGAALQNEIKRIYGNGKPSGTLNFENWPLYIDLDSKGNSPTLEKFTKATGITVNYKTDINDNDPFLASKVIPVLQSGQDTGFDLMVITNGGPVERLIKLGFLTPLDHNLLPNFFANASPSVKNPAYDPGNTFTVAWQSGMTAIGYNSKVVNPPPRSLGDLLNPKYKGKVGMFSNNQDLPCPALRYMGFDVQTSTPAQWRKTADMLKRARDQGIIRSFYDQSYINALENGDTVITQAWSGDIFIASSPKSAGGDGYSELKLALPQEGAILWTDNQCIPLRAQHPVDAITFMNFVYQPAIAAELADGIDYITPVPAAKAILEKTDPPIANSPLVFPPASALAKTQQYRVFKSADEEQEWNSVWEPVYSS